MTARRIEARIGELLGPSPGPGRPPSHLNVGHDRNLRKDERTDFRRGCADSRLREDLLDLLGRGGAEGLASGVAMNSRLLIGATER